MIKDNIKPSDWFSFYGNKKQAKARIFAFPYSGAGSSIFHSWAKKMESSGIQLVGVQLPGRENRFGENLIDDLPSLLENILQEIRNLTDKPYAFFGHSMGGLIAYELSRKIHAENLHLPKHLYVSAFRSPELENTNRPMAILNDDDFLSEIVNYGGMPNEVLENKEFLEIFLPILRADFLLTEYYSYKEGSILTIPISVFSGSEDNIVHPEQMNNWKSKTNKEFNHYKYCGKHFFINDHVDSIIEKLKGAFN